jgi:hypothetical protein
MTSPVNALIRGTTAPAQEDPEAAALVEAARAARFHNPAVARDLVAEADRQDPAAAVQALVRADPTLVRRTDADAGAGNSRDALPSHHVGQHPFSALIRRHWQGG